MRLQTSDGVRLAGRYWPGDTVGYVLAHGFTGSHTTARMAAIIAALTATGASVLAFDFRGHGASEGRSTLGDLETADLAAAVACLRERQSVPIAVLGWSMGGSVVLRHAGLGGDADAVVSVSSPGLWWERGTRAMRLVHWAAETRTGRVATRLGGRTRLGGEWPGLPASPIEVVDRIAPTPLLIVHGDADPYFPARHARLLAAAAPDAEFWLEPGMGHAETATTPELMARIDRWVRAALASRPPR
ncbi:MAG: lysophospholipase [Actinomycetia bacterium]|nr:lysophospholipase [Actinomycetes bacterium]